MKYASPQSPIFPDGGIQAVRIDPRVQAVLYLLVAGMVVLIAIAMVVSHVL